MTNLVKIVILASMLLFANFGYSEELIFNGDNNILVKKSGDAYDSSFYLKEKVPTAIQKLCRSVAIGKAQAVVNGGRSAPIAVNWIDKNMAFFGPSYTYQVLFSIVESYEVTVFTPSDTDGKECYLSSLKWIGDL